MSCIAVAAKPWATNSSSAIWWIRARVSVARPSWRCFVTGAWLASLRPSVTGDQGSHSLDDGAGSARVEHLEGDGLGVVTVPEGRHLHERPVRARAEPGRHVDGERKLG